MNCMMVVKCRVRMQINGSGPKGNVKGKKFGRTAAEDLMSTTPGFIASQVSRKF